MRYTHDPFIVSIGIIGSFSIGINMTLFLYILIFCSCICMFSNFK